MPPVSGVQVPRGYFDFPGFLRLPVTNQKALGGLQFVYQVDYAVAIICVCDATAEALDSPLAELGFTLTNIRRFSKNGKNGSTVGVHIGGSTPSDWENLRTPAGGRHGLTFVADFST
jgi:hypothetical protein